MKLIYMYACCYSATENNDLMHVQKGNVVMGKNINTSPLLIDEEMLIQYIIHYLIPFCSPHDSDSYDTYIKDHVITKCNPVN